MAARVGLHKAAWEVLQQLVSSLEAKQLPALLLLAAAAGQVLPGGTEWCRKPITNSPSLI